MTEEKAENPPVEKPAETTSQGSSHQENPPVNKQIEIREFAGKAEAGDQGVYFSPTIGVATPDPFISQDVAQSQPPAQTLPAEPPAAQPTITPSTEQSGGGSDSGE